jgi:hypothetical protein
VKLHRWYLQQNDGTPSMGLNACVIKCAMSLRRILSLLSLQAFTYSYLPVLRTSARIKVFLSSSLRFLKSIFQFFMSSNYFLSMGSSLQSLIFSVHIFKSWCLYVLKYQTSFLKSNIPGFASSSPRTWVSSKSSCPSYCLHAFIVSSLSVLKLNCILCHQVLI